MRERTMPWWFRRRDEERPDGGSEGMSLEHTGSGDVGRRDDALPPQGMPRIRQRQLPVKPDYTVVSAVNAKLLSLLRNHMVPNVLVSREEIGLCTPKDHGDMVFGIYLYDIRENSEIRVAGMQEYDGSHLKFPPVFLELSYMLTAYSAIDLRYREEENHRILTKAMQVLHDYPRLEGEDGLHIEFQNLTMDQKAAVWHNLGGGYQLSLFYKITPVRLESSVVRETARVREILIDASPEEFTAGGTAR